MIGVYAPMISEKPSRDTPAYKADKNAFAGFTLKINAMIKMINGTTIADPKLSMIAFKNSPDGDYTIPTVNAFACITGMGEDQFFEDVVAALKSVGK